MEGNVFRNSVEFGKWLESNGLSYSKVYEGLNGNGISEFNNVLDKSGVLIGNGRKEYYGIVDIHCSDNGARTPEEKDLDCAVGNIQEALFCIDNPDFMRNQNATSISKNSKDSDITKKELDLIHRPTGAKVEFKFCYNNRIDEKYGDVIYRHRDGGFADFLREGNIIIIYFANLGKVAVFDHSRLKDVEHGNMKGAVKIIGTNTDKYGKKWDSVAIWSGMLIDYHMFCVGNYEISKTVSKIYNDQWRRK